MTAFVSEMSAKNGMGAFLFLKGRSCCGLLVCVGRGWGLGRLWVGCLGGFCDCISGGGMFGLVWYVSGVLFVHWKYFGENLYET